MRMFQVRPVAEVFTDKIFTQIPSNYTGKIDKYFSKRMKPCLVGGGFLQIEVESDHAEAQKQEVQYSITTTTTNIQTIETKQTITNHIHNQLYQVRQLAKQKGIDLSKITETGKDGRILKTNLEKPAEKVAATTAITTNTPVTKAITNATFNLIKMSDFRRECKNL